MHMLLLNSLLPLLTTPPPPPPTPPWPVPPVQVERAKVLSNTIKQKRKEKAGKWEVPLPKVRPAGAALRPLPAGAEEQGFASVTSLVAGST